MCSKFYNSFPVNRAFYGLVLDYGPNEYERYCWLPDTSQYRRYLLDHKDETVLRIYVGWYRKWVTFASFLRFAKEPMYEKEKIKQMNKYV